MSARAPSPRWAGLIGVVHLRPLPGDPLYMGGGFAAVEAAALADAEALFAGGCDAAIVENFGSAPFVKGTGTERLPPHQVAALTRVASAIRDRFERPVGVNALRNDALAAVGIAAAAGLDCVRINIHTGAYVTDQGLIEGESAATLRYRRALEADGIALLADVLVKHAAPLAPLAMADAVRDAFERGLADAVIVTGAATGQAAGLAAVEAARAAAGEERLVLVGSGITAENAARFGPLVDGAIVGTALKEQGSVGRPVDLERVRALAEVLKPCLRGGGG